MALEGYEQTGSVRDYVKLTLGLAAPTPMIVEDVRKKVEGCIEAGAAATGCTVEYHGEMGYKNRVPNSVLGDFSAKTAWLWESPCSGCRRTAAERILATFRM